MDKNLHAQAVLFIEELDFMEKKAHLTVRAYSTDLQQFLTFFTAGHFTGPKIDGFPDYKFISDDESSTAPVAEETTLHQVASKYLHSISKLEASTRGRKVATLKKFFAFLKRENVITKIPGILVTPKKPLKLPHFISVDEVLSVMSSFKKANTFRDQQKELLFLLLYGAGLRVSEACALEWSHIDINNRKLRILGKGGKTRVISFPILLQSKLNAIEKDGSSIWGAQALHTRTAFNLIRECGQQSGLNKPLNPHALRHSFATHLLNDGADLRIIQELLGHSSLSATEKYTHISLDQLTQTMESFHPLAKKA